MRGLDQVFRMRHEAKHVAGLVHHAGDVVDRAIRVGAFGIAEHDLPVAFDARQRFGFALTQVTFFGFQRGAFGFLDRSFCLAKAFAQRLIKVFDVRGAAPSTPIGTLSGGNIQKVIIARELESGPSVLVMAHPTRGLDIGATSFVHDQMIAARARGVGILLISADFDEILEMSDRIVVCFEGRIMGEFSGSKPPINEISLAMTGK